MFKKSSTWLKTFNWLQISLYLLFIVVVFIVSFLSIRTFVDSDELISIISISIEITIVALTTLLTITLFLRNKVNQKEAALMEIKLLPRVVAGWFSVTILKLVFVANIYQLQQKKHILMSFSMMKRDLIIVYQI